VPGAPAGADQAAEVPAEDQALAERRLRAPGVAGSKIETQVADRRRPRPDRDFQEDLVTLGPQGHAVQKRPLQGEQTAQGVL
jgi:hypothetical protein